MAMDALRNLASNIPDWQRRLDDLNGQIERRQAELAAIAGTNPSPTVSPRSLRNKGSSESLKPKDDGPMHPDLDLAAAPRQNHAKRDALRTPSTPFGEAKAMPASPPSPDSESRAALHRQACEAVNAHARACAQTKKKQRSSLAPFAEGVPPTYRTRSMIIVYYDSYVQGFFDELVRFISSSRNLMRKAKMAAKVAQIKRMAELEIANDAQRTSDERFAVDAIPSLRYMNTRRVGTTSQELTPGEASRSVGPGQPADVYDSLDKSLEFVQSTCEHGAHQFLRDADCYDEIEKILTCLAEVLKAANQEIDRVQREDPELAKETGEMGKVRMHRPISVRRDMAAERKDEILEDECLIWEIPTMQDATAPAEMTLEVDTNLEEEDTDNLPVLQYRSTRFMRSHAV
ncbi:uncharacterized protein MAM_04318 [Metarhizium album ARSEF 1941]|uniref:Uncharacterized protein n=1 Tax=Metarhizium album (strain ARSEF 1941) TaxID=1081103 RepID=A0A0B2WWE4_METAS|nr:uncharacterized protein MAM_04318 [Metarhizium album ARSEF 1941]KHN97929.1 hypothetical protein MAM_04318 [Metarhizium album ARSEF 1941]